MEAQINSLLLRQHTSGKRKKNSAHSFWFINSLHIFNKGITAFIKSAFLTTTRSSLKSAHVFVVILASYEAKVKQYLRVSYDWKINAKDQVIYCIQYSGFIQNTHDGHQKSKSDNHTSHVLTLQINCFAFTAYFVRG